MRYVVQTPSHTFNLESKDIEVLGTQLATEHIVDYYPSLADAQNGTNALIAMYSNTNTTETIYARISNKANANCFAITNFDLEVKIAPVFKVVEDWVVCDSDIDGLYNFDLETKNNEVLYWTKCYCFYHKLL